MKVILDTNIWISMIIFTGKLEAIYNRWLTGDIKTCFSEVTYNELETKLIKFSLECDKREVVEEFIGILNKRCEIYRISEKYYKCRDPKDNKFLDISDCFGAEYLITGDKDLLVLKKIGMFKIINPTTFIEKY